MPIVAIGGGELGDGETLAIDQFIVSHSSKPQPKALFLPTASGDAPGYIDTFERVYGQKLKCDTQSLSLSRSPSPETIADAIQWADLIYVGGGNTRRMIASWREHGVDRLLHQAWEQHKMLCGLSAGAICWFESGFSDSDSFETDGEWSFTRVEGLGFVPGLFCPHLDVEHRALPLLNHLERHPESALAATNQAAVVVADGQMSVLCSQPDAGVYRIEPVNDGLHWSRLS